MNRAEFDALEHRIAKRADALWHEAGRPEGPRVRFLDRARELVAIEGNPRAGTRDPDETAEPRVEEASLMANLGEFASMSDAQGEEGGFAQADAGSGGAPLPGSNPQPAPQPAPHDPEAPEPSPLPGVTPGAKPNLPPAEAALPGRDLPDPALPSPGPDVTPNPAQDPSGPAPAYDPADPQVGDPAPAPELLRG